MTTYHLTVERPGSNLGGMMDFSNEEECFKCALTYKRGGWTVEINKVIYEDITDRFNKL